MGLHIPQERYPMKITEVRVIITCPLRNYVVVKIMTDEPGSMASGMRP
jgi:hypothetical protein